MTTTLRNLHPKEAKNRIVNKKKTMNFDYNYL